MQVEQDRGHAETEQSERSGIGSLFHGLFP